MSHLSIFSFCPNGLTLLPCLSLDSLLLPTSYATLGSLLLQPQLPVLLSAPSQGLFPFVPSEMLDRSQLNLFSFKPFLISLSFFTQFFLLSFCLEWLTPHYCLFLIHPTFLSGSPGKFPYLCSSIIFPMYPSAQFPPLFLALLLLFSQDDALLISEGSKKHLLHIRSCQILLQRAEMLELLKEKGYQDLLTWTVKSTFFWHYFQHHCNGDTQNDIKLEAAFFSSWKWLWERGSARQL